MQRSELDGPLDRHDVQVGTGADDDVARFRKATLLSCRFRKVAFLNVVARPPVTRFVDRLGAPRRVPGR
jgi:hypothetical protein